MTFWEIFFAVITALVVWAFFPYILLVVGALFYALWWIFFGWWVNWMRKHGL